MLALSKGRSENKKTTKPMRGSLAGGFNTLSDEGNVIY